MRRKNALLLKEVTFSSTTSSCIRRMQTGMGIGVFFGLGMFLLFFFLCWSVPIPHPYHNSPVSLLQAHGFSSERLLGLLGRYLNSLCALRIECGFSVGEGGMA
jgi:hypothetical protein